MDTNKKRDNSSQPNLDRRRSLITGMGVAVAGLAATSTAHAQRRSSGFQPERHALDAWLDELPGSHRVFVDSASPAGGGDALLYANNVFATHTAAYDGDASDIALVVCFRHLSTPFGFNDAIWEKYGEAINAAINFPDPTTQKAPKVNMYNSPDHPTMPNFGNTIDSVGARGAQFAICNNATNFFATQIAAATGASQQEVYQELTSNAIPNSRFVAAGVIALTRAQEYGYSLLYAG